MKTRRGEQLQHEPDRPEPVERVDPREVVAVEEERHAEAGERQQVDVLGRLEEAPAHARVLGVVAGDELGVGLGQVERRRATSRRCRRSGRRRARRTAG